MKYLICSDIHGSFSAAEKVIHHFENMKCDRLLILGDTLYHGPRNPLPEGHNPKAVYELLNKFSDKISACRGNCDAEVDQKVLNFSTMSDSFTLKDNDITLFCTHGHIFAPLNEDDSLPINCEDAKTVNLSKNSVFFYGHTHISVLEKHSDGIIICNPGSVSLPKGGTKAGFALYENRTVTLFDIDGNKLKSLSI